MSYKIKSKEISGQSQVVEINECPQECPICHTSANLKFVASAYKNAKPPWVQVVFRCMKPDCSKLFIAAYKKNGMGPFNLIGVDPVRPQLPIFPRQIQDISPMFVEMYNQAVIAEASDLIQLLGIGMAKAFEFLIKDFTIFKKPEEEETIKSTPLTKCIDSFIDDPGIHRCIKLAPWLCNEETYYVKKWVEQDIDDLKILIKMTINWIENHLLMEQYTKQRADKDIPDFSKNNKAFQKMPSALIMSESVFAEASV